MGVRHEKVILELDDRFSTPTAKAALAAALLDKSLNDIDGTAIRTRDTLPALGNDVDSLGSSFRRAESDIDRLSGRLGIMRDVAITLGPAIIPLGAVGIPALTGLASAFGFTAIGASSAVVAFQGVGDALDALRKAQLEPTTENLEAARQAMEQIGPHAQEFATQLLEMGPAFAQVRDAAAAGLFPGLSESLDNLEGVLPRVATLFRTIGDALGDLADNATESLAGQKWVDFFHFVRTEGADTLRILGHTLGDVAHGFSELWMAFGPLNRDFTGWLRDSATAFDKWATGLAQTEGFQEFVDYIRENGPRVADAMGAIGNALIQVVEAAAPLGGPVLELITGLADAVALVAGSSAGPALFGLAAGMAAVSRASKIAGPGLASMSEAFLDLRTSPDKARTAIERFGGAARIAAGGAGIALFATSLTETNDQLRTFEGVIGGALAGFAIGGGWGAAIGGAVGLFTSLANSAEETSAQVQAFADALIQSKGVIDDTVRSIAVTSLEDAGIFEDAEQLGLDLELVTDAALGNANAIAAVEAALSGYGSAVAAVSGSKGSYIAGYDEEAAAAQRVREAVNGTSDALGSGVDEARRHAEAMGETGDASRDAAGGMNEAQQAALDLSDALSILAGWLDRREAMRGWNDAINELAKSIRNGFTRQDAENIDAVGRSFIQVAESLEGKPHQQETFIDGAIKQLQALAREAGPRAKAEINGLIEQLQRVARVDVTPKIELEDGEFTRRAGRARERLTELDRFDPNPRLDMNTSAFDGKHRRAKADIQDLDNDKALPLADMNNAPFVSAYNSTKSMLRNLDGDVATVTVQVRRIGASIAGAVGGSLGIGADGTTVPKTGLAYADRHLYMLADGERVTSNRYGQVDNSRKALDLINAGKLNDRILGLADGGTVGRPTHTPGMDWLPSVTWLSFLEDAVSDFDNGVRWASKVFRLDADLREQMLRDRLKQWEREKDAITERIEMYKQERQAIKDSVASLLGIQGGSAITNFTQASSAVRGSLFDARDLAGYLSQLEAAGFDGPALQWLLSQNNLGLVESFAGQSAAQLANFEQQFAMSNSWANAVGQQAWGASGHADDLRDARRDRKEANQHLRDLTRRMERLEKLAERNPKETGQETARAMTDAVAGG